MIHESFIDISDESSPLFIVMCGCSVHVRTAPPSETVASLRSKRHGAIDHRLVCVTASTVIIVIADHHFE